MTDQNPFDKLLKAMLKGDPPKRKASERFPASEPEPCPPNPPKRSEG